MNIKFGTDGWRGIISRDFTFENLLLVAQALANYLIKTGDASGGVVIGYDTRFLSEQYALEVAKVLAGNGIRAMLANKPVITPVVSYAVSLLQAEAGVMITASHSSYEYNGFKLKGKHGGPALPQMVTDIENQTDLQPKMTTADDERIIRFNPDEMYIKAITNWVDLDLIRHSGLKVIVDVMHGAGRGYIKSLISGDKSHVIEIRNTVNPAFGGIQPEPTPQNLTSLVNVLLGFEANLALATDCDGDRLGVIDHHGQFVDAHHIFILLLKHLIENRKLSGSVVKTFSTTRMVDKLAEKYQLHLIETPVGFKHICDYFLHDDILMAGEESGGFGFKNHLPERDGILAGLILLELLATSGLSLRELLDQVEKEIGKFVYRRVDLKMTPKHMQRFHDVTTDDLPTRIAGIPVDWVEDMDGYKFFLKNGSWVLVRPSGTEPILRVYAEGRSLEEVEEILMTHSLLGIF